MVFIFHGCMISLLRNKQQKAEASTEIWLYNILPPHYKISCPLPSFREMTIIHTDQREKNDPSSKPIFYHFKIGFRKKPNRLE